MNNNDKHNKHITPSTSTSTPLDTGELEEEEISIIDSEIESIYSVLFKVSDHLDNISGRLERANSISASSKTAMAAILSLGSAKCLVHTCPTETLMFMCMVACVGIHDHELVSSEQTKRIIEYINRNPQAVRDGILSTLKGMAQ